MIEYITTWLQLKSDRRAVTALEYGQGCSTLTSWLAEWVEAD